LFYRVITKKMLSRYTQKLESLIFPSNYLIYYEYCIPNITKLVLKYLKKKRIISFPMMLEYYPATIMSASLPIIRKCYLNLQIHTIV